MTPSTAHRRAIAALKERVKKQAFNSNLYQCGARSPEIVRAWNDRQADLSAIEFFMEAIENAKQIQRPQSPH